MSNDAKPLTIFERMMGMSRQPDSSWRVEQQAKSGLGSVAWLPVGSSFPTRGQAEAEAARLRELNGLPTRVVEVKS